MKRKLKILALHSFRTSAAIFKEQLRRSGLLQALDDLIELVFVDAPNPASGPVPDDVSPFFDPPYFEWWNAHRDPTTDAWSYENASVSLAFLNDILKLHGPFDGVMGFSQGAATATLLTGMQRSGKALTEHPPLQFLVCFAGIRVRDPKLEKYYAALAPVPAVHIIGDRDPVKRMTNHLIEAFNNPLVINHSRGHVIPALTGEDLAKLRKFLEEQQDKVEQQSPNISSSL
ncbi:hypothetical protein Ndes2526B_g00612 [Nannochloris sp. 'desiccata']|nr:hypothetical protein KSW81_003910 [Chlorella desiccata (nom. nud.)]KAH7624415.1 putative Esterase [Chlorella desiccata (nom. nud.)]